MHNSASEKRGHFQSKSRSAHNNNAPLTSNQSETLRHVLDAMEDCRGPVRSTRRLFPSHYSRHRTFQKVKRTHSRPRNVPGWRKSVSTNASPSRAIVAHKWFFATASIWMSSIFMPSHLPCPLPHTLASDDEPSWGRDSPVPCR